MILAVIGLSGCAEVTDVLLGKNQDKEKTQASDTIPDPAPPPDTVEAPASASRAQVQEALQRGSEEANKLGVRISAAVSSKGWGSPAQVDGDEPLRMWSMAKAVTAIAALNATRGGKGNRREIEEAMNGALLRSENCRQRLMVLWLQRIKGSPQAAAAAVQAELRRAGVTNATLPTQAAAMGQDCTKFLNTSSVENPLGPALQLGTATWTANSASRFALALASDRLGASGDTVFGAMQRPKQASRELEGPDDFTASLNWGAGRALGDLNPAYKAGWGGTEQKKFVSGQIAALRLGVGDYGIAVYGIPDQQPSNDDPGKTSAPQAVEIVMSEIRRALIGS